ncbi:MAG: methyltransferase domain-containing protein [Candidatus Obscuribacterales bacterium]|nr:methyltransferase domain-containing protein [Candidatus Obscuribacterales bacterium]
MKRIEQEEHWPESWKTSFTYDLLEIYGEKQCYGYAYAYANRQKAALELIQSVAKPGDKILDLAAGQGNFSLFLAEAGYDVTWNDIREELIPYVQLKHESGKLSYVPGNIFELGINQLYDAVLITEVIEHTAHPDEFLQKVALLVKPGGYIVLTTPNGGYFLNRLPRFSDCSDPSIFESVQFGPNSDGHIFLLHLDELMSLSQKAGLTVVETRLLTNPLTNGHLKTEGLLRYLPPTLINMLENFTGHCPLFVRKKLHTNLAALLKRSS